MVNHYAFAALKEKRAEITGKIKEHARAVARLKIALGHLDATMRLFDPNYPIEAIRTRRAQWLQLFKHGELGRCVLDALR